MTRPLPSCLCRAVLCCAMLCCVLPAGTCWGKSQFPCKNSLPSDDGCSGAQGPPATVNVGGIGAANQGSKVAQEAAAAAARFGRNDLAAARLDLSKKTVKKGEACGDKNGKWGNTNCPAGSWCKQSGSNWVCA